MALKTSLTGSFPPIYDPNKPIRNLPRNEQDDIAHKCLERAIRDQIDLGIDILVDGQGRDEIVSLFSLHIPGFSGSTLPYRVTARVRPAEQPITAADYLIAKELAGGKPIKAHITGAMTIARDAAVDPESGYAGKTDPLLVRDIANALGHEARFLVDAGAEIVQIDEPVLADGVDLDLAFDAMRQIIEIGEIPLPALHVCGNVCKILDSVLTHSPVKIVSLEGSWLKYEELSHIDGNYLTQRGKQLGLGCIAVADYKVERLRTIQDFLDQMVSRFGPENVWAVTPNCGFRPMPYEAAKAKLKVMVEAAQSF